MCMSSELGFVNAEEGDDVYSCSFELFLRQLHQHHNSDTISAF
jgi:hypothetical protein